MVCHTVALQEDRRTKGCLGQDLMHLRLGVCDKFSCSAIGTVGVSIPILWLIIGIVAIIPYTSKRPQKDIGNYVGPYSTPRLPIAAFFLGGWCPSFFIPVEEGTTMIARGAGFRGSSWTLEV